MLPIYVVNLPRANQRRAAIQRHLDALQLQFTFVPGTDGSALSSEQIQEVYSEGRARAAVGRALTAGEIGCYLSHVSTWREVAHSDAPFGLVLEDDARLNPRVVELLRRIDRFPRTVDICNLIPTNRKQPYKTSFVRRYRVIPGHRLVRVFGHMWGAAAYLVRPRAAQLLLRHAFPIQQPVDSFWSEHGTPKLELYTVEPYLVSCPYGDCEQSHLEAQRKVAQSTVLAPAPSARSIGWRGRVLRRLVGESGRQWLRGRYQSVRAFLRRWT